MTTPATLRDQLADLLVKDLRGPWDGEQEIVRERNVRGRYVVGLLAPRGQTPIPDSDRDLDEDGTTLDAAGEEGTGDARPPRAATTLLPSSIGLTFTVAKAATALRVTAHWGRYERKPEDEAATLDDVGGSDVDGSDAGGSDAVAGTPGSGSGRTQTAWQRHPMGGVVTVPLVAGRTKPLSPCPAQPDVTVEGLVRDRKTQWVVTLFLVNGQDEPAKNKDMAWVFQPELVVQAPDDAPIFERQAPLKQTADEDSKSMAMRYRKRVQFAVGHGTGVGWADAGAQYDRTTRLWTDVMPTWDVPQTTPPDATDLPDLAGLQLDMDVLAETPDGQFGVQFAPLVTAYAAWIAQQEARLADPTPDLQPHTETGARALAACRTALERIRAGIALLDSDPQAAAAFRFANGAMARQRVQSQVAAAVRRGDTPDLATLDVPQNRSWRVFQLGFLLLNLPGLTDVRHAERVGGANTDAAAADPIADLLWFPTGGGKTEAYLGLAAYTLAIRRLQGTVGGRSGHAGVAVLMRYTLRLLTLQQFQRAAALLCACEVIRRDAPDVWGAEPFRIGLWVGGNSTPNSITHAKEALDQLRKSGYNRTGGGSPHQLTSCPWCGNPITSNNLTVDTEQYRMLTYCGDMGGECPFTERNAPGEGVPVMVVDEEIYRRLPSVLIATVDKFAQMPWNGQTAALFGLVDGSCARHGYHVPDMEACSDHRAKGNLPATTYETIAHLRPPDLIIQDELHLISGPLGTLVGLYETAVDTLATWQVDGVAVRPKVVASTATIRRADAQVRSLFAREVRVFPPQGLDAEDTFFARERPTTERPGRRYLGICTPGIRHKTALIQTAVALLALSARLYDDHGADADPYMTLVGYFNALRELAAMRRSVDDTVSARLGRMGQRGLPIRRLDPQRVAELTSRLSAGEIPNILDQLEKPYVPVAGQRAGGNRRTTRRTSQDKPPVDVLLATNMISVGVDINRLGVMLVGGQPKATAEYIQATSRVGRRHPGLVCVVYNWTRPRDLSHYEQFRNYHETFYQHVEALSVTPFAPRALDRGLSALLTALIRLRDMPLNPNTKAGALTSGHAIVATTLSAIAARAATVADNAVAQIVTADVQQRVATWEQRATNAPGGKLAYKASTDYVALLKTPDTSGRELFTCLNSLRDVEPTVNLLLDDDGISSTSSRAAPAWAFGTPPATPDSVDTDTP